MKVFISHLSPCPHLLNTEHYSIHFFGLKNCDISYQNEQAFKFKFCPTQHHLITRGIIKEEGGAR